MRMIQFKKNEKTTLISIVLTIVLLSSFISFDFPSTVQANSTFDLTDRSDFEKGTYENLVISNSGAEVELKLVHGSWVKKTLSVRPNGTKNNPIASVWGTDKILLFNSDGETWIYDYSDNSWLKKTPQNSPSPRKLPSMASIHNTDNIILFGGRGYDNNFYNDTWIYDLSDNLWTKKQMVTGPLQRYNSCMSSIYNDDKVVMFGGFSGILSNQYLNDTWVYDLSDNSWNDKNPKNKPSINIEHSMAFIFNTDKIILFGGRDNLYVRYNETWEYDLSDNNWTKKNITSDNPTPRIFSGMSNINNKEEIMIFGGIDQNQEIINDTWIYNLALNKWTNIITTQSPAPRYFHSIATLTNSDTILLFGGENDDINYNDTWVFKPYSYAKEGFFESSQFDSGGYSSFKFLEWTAEIPLDTEIKFQIKTADEELLLNSISYLGHDGTIDTFYQSSPSTIWVGHNNDRWFQFKAYFKTTNEIFTPILKNILISYNIIPNPEILLPENGTVLNISKPEFKWNFLDPDSASQSAFQIIIDDDTLFNSINYESGEQNSVLDHWQFPIGTSYNAISDGTWYWKIRTKDYDGDWSKFSPSRKFIVDTMPPESHLIFPEDGLFYNNVNIISGNAFDPLNGVGINKVEIQIMRMNDGYYWSGLDWVVSDHWLLTKGTSKWNFNTSNISWDSGFQYEIKSRAMDNISNIEIPDKGKNFFIDKNAPVSSITMPIDNSYLNNSVIISGYADDLNGSGIKEVEISIQKTGSNLYWGGNSWDEGGRWLKVQGNGSWYYNSNNINWTSDTRYSIISRAIDIIGNVESEGLGNTFMFDNIDPEISILINNNASYTNRTNVTLLLTAEDSGSGVSQMALSLDDVLWSDWENYTSLKNLELPSLDGENFVYLKLKDRANNIAKPVMDSIYLDTKPPTNLSIRINNNTIETNSSSVTLQINAKDNISGLYKMSFSNDGINWGSWKNYTMVSTYILPPGDGIKTIYLRVKDNADNIAQPINDTIILNSAQNNENNNDPDQINKAFLSRTIILILCIIIISILVSIMIFNKKSKLRNGTDLKTENIPTYLPPAEKSKLSSENEAAIDINLRSSMIGQGIDDGKDQQMRSDEAQIQEFKALPPAKDEGMIENSEKDTGNNN